MTRKLSLGLGLAAALLFAAPADVQANPFKDFGRAVKDGAKTVGRGVKDGAKTVGRGVKGVFKGGAGTRSGAKAGGRRHGGKRHGGPRHRRH